MAAAPELQQAAAAGAAPLYLPDAAAMQRAGAGSWELTPSTAQSMVAISLAADQPDKRELLPAFVIATLRTVAICQGSVACKRVITGLDAGATGDGARSMLLLFSEQPRGLSQRQRSWAASIASKLGGACL